MKTKIYKSNHRSWLCFIALAGSGFHFLNSNTSVWAQTYASERGHVLDANQRVGSLGWNTPMRLDPISRRVNFGITGNLRYGASFQGLVPYRNANEFGSLLGSGTLSNFRRDSSGFADLGTRSYRQQTPYIDPSRQVTRAVDGKVVNTSQLYPTQNNNSLTTSRNNSNILRSQTRVLRPLNRPDFAMSVGSPFTQSLQHPPPLSAAPPLQSDDIMENNLQGSSGIGLLSPDTTEQQTETPEDITDEMSNTPQSYYEELQERLLPQTPGLSELGSDLASPLDEFVEIPEEQVDPESLKRAPSVKDRIIAERLKGENQFLFQSQMQLGESLMKKSKYYKAANAYDIAAIYEPDNPVVLLAQSHAFLAAGELASSAYYLDQALVREPAFVKTVIDPRDLFKDEDQFQARMAALDRWYDRTENEKLKFLKAYVMLQTDQREQAKQLFTELVDAQSKIASVKLLSDHMQNSP